jgi:hypothetical protein
VIDGERPPLRHHPGAPFIPERSLAMPPAGLSHRGPADKCAQAPPDRSMLPERAGRHP